jgi:hypothetical protein
LWTAIRCLACASLLTLSRAQEHRCLWHFALPVLPLSSVASHPTQFRRNQAHSLRPVAVQTRSKLERPCMHTRARDRTNLLIWAQVTPTFSGWTTQGRATEGAERCPHFLGVTNRGSSGLFLVRQLRPRILKQHGYSRGVPFRHWCCHSAPVLSQQFHIAPEQPFHRRSQSQQAHELIQLLRKRQVRRTRRNGSGE